MPEILSDLMNRGIAITPPVTGSYVEISEDDVVCTCALGAACVPVVGLNQLRIIAENITDDDYDGDGNEYLLQELIKVVGYDLRKEKAISPATVRSPFYETMLSKGSEYSLSNIIIDLVDYAGWSREEVVTWLRSIGK